MGAMTHGPYVEVVRDETVFDKCVICGYLQYKRAA